MPAKEYPFYFKSTVILFGLILLSYVLFNLKEIFAPIAFSLIVGILLNPLVTIFRRKKFPHILAIICAMLIALLGIAAVVYFLSSQIARFSEAFPVLQEKILELLEQLQSWLRRTLDVTIPDPEALVKEAAKKGTAALGHSISSALGTLGLIFLVPVYVFLLLFYKNHILNFLYDVFANEHSKKVEDVLFQTKMAIQSYMVGLLIEMVIVSVMNSAALLLLGVQYAILIGVIGGILNLIPYLGGIVAIAIPVLMATVTKDGYSTQLGVIVAYMVIQFIDNNILVPRIVSSKVQINALFSVITVLLGGALWGVAGMFLSIPIVAILKIIFDRVHGMKPWGKLLGDEVATTRSRLFRRRPSAASVAEKVVAKTESKKKPGSDPA
jgi:predicted PurR-regulated permease PerM